MEKLEIYLNDIEERIDVDQEEQLYQDWITFAEGKWQEEYFDPKRTIKTPSKIQWPEININDALEDDDLMIISQFAMCSKELENGSGSIMSVRSNYGVGIIPSLFGVKKFVMPYEMNTLPNVHQLENGIEDIKRIIDSNIPDFSAGWGEKVFRLGKRYQEIREKYPKIGKYVRIDHPDAQGPMDLCELLWGSNLFLDLYDHPDLVHSFLRKITDTYKAFLEHWFSIVPNIDNYHAFFGSLHKGSITVRDDSAMNLSPAIFEEFIYPYDNEVLNHFNGGAIHYCGKGDHFSPYFSKMNKLYAVNLSQPSYNNKETIYQNTIDKGINLIALDSSTVKDALDNNRRLNGLVHTSM